MARLIPNGSKEIQTGLWLYSYNKTIGGNRYTFNELYSSEGYCFYDNTWEEDARIYWQYMSIETGIPDTSIYTSIPISELPDGAEIASKKTGVAL